MIRNEFKLTKHPTKDTEIVAQISTVKIAFRILLPMNNGSAIVYHEYAYCACLAENVCLSLIEKVRWGIVKECHN